MCAYVFWVSFKGTGFSEYGSWLLEGYYQGEMCLAFLFL